MSHTYVGNVVDKGDREDRPEGQNAGWIGCCTWSGVLCVGSQHLFMQLLEGLHSWTPCRAQEAEKLQLNPSENKQTVYLLGESQLGIPLPFTARVTGVQGSCTSTKL